MPGTFTPSMNNYVQVLNDMADASALSTIASTTSTQNLDFSLGRVFNITLGTSATTTFTFSNLPTNLNSYSVLLFIKQNSAGSKLIAMPGSVKWPAGTIQQITATANRTDIYRINTFDGGTTWYAYREAADYT